MSGPAFTVSPPRDDPARSVLVCEIRCERHGGMSEEYTYAELDVRDTGLRTGQLQSWTVVKHRALHEAERKRQRKSRKRCHCCIGSSSS